VQSRSMVPISLGSRNGPARLAAACFAALLAVGACAGSSPTPPIIYITLPPASATPTPAPTAEITATAEITPTAEPTPTGTPTPTPTAAPTPTTLPVASKGTWTLTGSMTQKRFLHTATLLQNGNVLIAGGGSSAVAEIYNPASGTFTPTGAMKVNRSSHTATLLNDGRVLIAGGEDMATNVLSSLELYNPVTGTFVLAGNMLFPRTDHTATLLSSGTVLLAGGRSGATAVTTLKAAETWSPVSGHSSSTAAMTMARAWHSATTLASGKVLVAGGSNADGVTNSAELYDVSSGHWTATGSLAQARAGHAATLILAGRVLVSGGYAYCPGVTPTPPACIDSALTAAEMYNPSTGKFTKTNSMLVARGAATVPLASVLLPDGRVLVPGGGLHSGSSIATAETYRPATAKFSLAANMHSERVGHTVTLLPSGKVLVTGGVDGDAGTSLATAELYDHH
jgi:large repetitive protein